MVVSPAKLEDSVILSYKWRDRLQVILRECAAGVVHDAAIVVAAVQQDVGGILGLKVVLCP